MFLNYVITLYTTNMCYDYRNCVTTLNVGVTIPIQMSCNSTI